MTCTLLLVLYVETGSLSWTQSLPVQLVRLGSFLWRTSCLCFEHWTYRWASISTQHACVSEYPNTAPHSFRASSLTTGPSPQPEIYHNRKTGYLSVTSSQRSTCKALNYMVATGVKVARNDFEQRLRECTTLSGGDETCLGNRTDDCDTTKAHESGSRKRRMPVGEELGCRWKSPA